QDEYDAYLTLLYATIGAGLRPEQLEAMRAVAAQPGDGHMARFARAVTAPESSFGPVHGRRLAARARWQEYFRTHDAFLLPTTCVAASPPDASPNSMSRRLTTPEGSRDYMDLSFWISFATLTGLPATTAPVGLTRDNLPVGIQIVGPYLEDATPIDIAGRLA